MNCTESKKVMIMFREASLPQQEEVMKHIRSCELCQLEWSEIQSFEGILTTVSDQKPSAKENLQLMDKIMNAIDAKTLVAESGLTRWLSLFWIRFSLSSASLILVLFFIYEVTATEPPQAVARNIHATGATTVVNASQLRKRFVERENRNSWKEQCYSVALGRTDMKCLKEKLSTTL